MVNQIDNDVFEFSIYLPHATSVELASDFTGWRTPLAMRRDRDGWWRVQTAVPEGDHEFFYYVNGTARMPDYAANGVRFGPDGRLVSLLCVESQVAA